MYVSKWNLDGTVAHAAFVCTRHVACTRDSSNFDDWTFGCIYFLMRQRCILPRSAASRHGEMHRLRLEQDCLKCTASSKFQVVVDEESTLLCKPTCRNGRSTNTFCSIGTAPVHVLGTSWTSKEQHAAGAFFYFSNSLQDCEESEYLNNKRNREAKMLCYWQWATQARWLPKMICERHTSLQCKLQYTWHSQHAFTTLATACVSLN